MRSLHTGGVCQALTLFLEGPGTMHSFDKELTGIGPKSKWQFLYSLVQNSTWVEIPNSVHRVHLWTCSLTQVQEDKKQRGRARNSPQAKHMGV